MADDRTVLPPPRAVVSAAYLTQRADGTPGLILEVCPACTARLPLSDRQCSCRVPCTWDGCHHDDPMTKLVTGGGDG